MNKLASWVLICGFLITAIPALASREITIGYQGVIESKGELLNGTSFFKFALCSLDCATTYWSNDNSSISGSEPSTAVTLRVDSGIFNLMLGDTSLENMAEIPVSVFQNIGDENLYLRVWFNDGYNGFERLEPDQRVSIVPYAAMTELVGGVVTVNSLDMTGMLNLEVNDLTSSGGIAFKIADSTNTLFSVDQRGTAFSRDLALQPLTSASDLNRLTAGRIYYDGSTNKFMGCNNSNCSEIGLAGSSGVADITAVTAGSGLIGGATSGNATLSVDTTKVVTKTGDHTMAGSLTAATLSAPTITSTTAINAKDLTATGTVSANALSVTTVTTTGGITMPPTGTGAGNTAELQFKELAATGTHYVGLKAPDSILTSKLWVLPAADGQQVPEQAAENQVLSTDGHGNLSWKTDAHEGGDITSVSGGTGIDADTSTGAALVSLAYSDSLESNALPGGTGVFYSSADTGGILFEGSTFDDYEGRLTVVDPTADRTWTLPDASGTVVLSTDCTSVVVTGEFTFPDNTTSRYFDLVDRTTFSADETDVDEFMVPIAMHARNLRAEVDAAPNGVGKKWTITLRVNRATPAPALTCDIEDTATNCSDITNAPSIAAGDKLDILVAPSALPSGTTMNVSFCLGP